MNKLLDEAVEHIKSWEKLRLSSYDDATGKTLAAGEKPLGTVTIGWGHTKTAEAGHTISQAMAEQLLQEDLFDAQTTVQRLVNVPLTDEEYGALVSFVFNVGQPQFEKSTLRRRLNAGENKTQVAAEELPKWNKTTIGGKKVVSAGLVKRRAAELLLFTKAKTLPVPPTANVVDHLLSTNTAKGAGSMALIATIAQLAQILGGLDWKVSVAMIVCGLLGVLIWRKYK
jgi:lysozyme